MINENTNETLHWQCQKTIEFEIYFLKDKIQVYRANQINKQLNWATGLNSNASNAFQTGAVCKRQQKWTTISSPYTCSVVLYSARMSLIQQHVRAAISWIDYLLDFNSCKKNVTTSIGTRRKIFPIITRIAARKEGATQTSSNLRTRSWSKKRPINKSGTHVSIDWVTRRFFVRFIIFAFASHYVVNHKRVMLISHKGHICVRAKIYFAQPSFSFLLPDVTIKVCAAPMLVKRARFATVIALPWW